MRPPAFARVPRTKDARASDRPAEARTAVIAEGLPLFREALAWLVDARLGIRAARTVGETDSALKAVCAVVPALLVVDRDLPGGDVFQLMSQVRHFCPQTRMALVGLRLGETDVRLAIAANVGACALKSDPPEDLTMAIREAFFGEAYLTPGVRAGLFDRPASQGDPDKTLTERELEVLAYVARGLSVRQIAELMCKGRKTIDSTKCSVMKKLGIHNKVQLTHYAFREGLISL
jgi:DNA-binding NarL/FixJ family response regulator